jgi:lysophospholipase L1-like esterase
MRNIPLSPKEFPMRCTRFERFWLAMAISLSLFAASAFAKDTPPESVKPVSKPDAKWIKRHQSMNDRVKKGNVDLLLIGDSITNGWEGRGKDVWKKYYEKRNAVNLGISGDRTQHVLWRLENGNLEGISPKLAVIMIGTNNVGSQSDPRNSPEEIAAGVKAIVDKLRAKLPEMKVLVLAIFPRGADAKDEKRQTVGKINEILAKLADGKKVFYLDIGDKFLAPDGKLPKEVMPDGLHPNAKGYQIWAEAMEPTVAKLMGDEPVKNDAESGK